MLLALNKERKEVDHQEKMHGKQLTPSKNDRDLINEIYMESRFFEIRASGIFKVIDCRLSSCRIGKQSNQDGMGSSLKNTLGQNRHQVYQRNETSSLEYNFGK